MQKIFIVGLYKSGTTWLLRCLGAHPAVVAVKELDLIRATNGNETKNFTVLPYDEVLKNIFGRSAFLNLSKDLIEKHGEVYQRSASEILTALRGCKKIKLEQERPPIQNFINCMQASKFRYPTICYRMAFGNRASENPRSPISFDDVEDRYLLGVINSIRASDSAVGMMDAFVNGIQLMFNNHKALVLKGADQVARFDLLEQWMPQAKKIAIVRDGRDACLSAHHYRLLMKEKNAAFTPQDASVDFRVLLQGWKSRAQMLINLSGNPNLKIIRYEDLLRDFENTLSDLFVFLELSADKELVMEIKLRNSFRMVTGRRSGKAAKDIFRSGIYGEWIKVLGTRQKEEAWAIAGQQLEVFGYSRNGELNPMAIHQ